MSRLQELIAELCPDGVEYKALGEVFEKRNGYTPSKNNSSYWEGGTIPWFRMEDIRANGTVLNDAIQHVTDAALKKGGAFPANSIIVATSATIGAHALITCDFLCNQRFTCLTLREAFADCFDLAFLNHYFVVLDEYCLANVNQGSFASVKMGAFDRFRIPVPPIEVQREVVCVLDEYAAAHDELVRQLEEEMGLREQELSIARNKMCVNEDWQLEAVGNVFTTITGGTPKKSNADYYGDGYPFYKPGDLIHGTIVSSAEDGLTEEGLASTRNVPSSSILMTCIGASIGKTAMVSALGSCNQQINAVLPRDGMNMRFYLHVLCSDYFQKQVMTRGSFDNMPILSRGKFDKLLVPVPLLEVQDKVASVLDGLSGAINESLSLLREELSIQEQLLSGVRNELLSFPEKVG